ETQQRRAATLASALVIAEEKRLVLFDRPAQGEAKLVPVQRLLGPPTGVRKEVGGIEFTVAKELESRPVPVVGAGFDGGGNEGYAVAKLRRKGVLLHLELLDGIDGWQQVAGAYPEIAGLGSVNEVVRVFGALAVNDDGKFPSHFLIDLAAPAALRLAYTRNQLGQVQIVASIERQVHNGLILDDLPGSRSLRLQQRRCGFHLHLLRHRAKFGCHIQARRLIDL